MEELEPQESGLASQVSMDGPVRAGHNATPLNEVEGGTKGIRDARDSFIPSAVRRTSGRGGEAVLLWLSCACNVPTGPQREQPSLRPARLGLS